MAEGGKEGEPGEITIAVRGIQLIKKKINHVAEDIKNTRKRGLLALTMPTERTLFLGMHSRLDANFEKLESLFEEAEEYSITHGVTPHFPSQNDKALFDQTRLLYYEAHGFAEQLKSQETRATRDSVSRVSLNQTLGAGANSSRAILPKINIKKFSGDISQWSTFKQLFQSLIKDEESLTNAERFHYLMSYVEGPAHDAIKHIPFNENHFSQAWEALCQCFDDKRKLASAHVEKLLNFKPHTGKPTAESLQTFLSCVSESISALENMQIPDLKNYLLCELALRGLDPITREAFELANADKAFPSFLELREFVQRRCLVYRRSGSSDATSTAVNANKTQSTSHPKSIRSPNKFAPKTGASQALLVHTAQNDDQAPPLICYVCRQHHIISDCDAFRKASPIERRSLLMGFQGCFNCLYPFHTTDRCKSKFTCKDCNGKHHTFLHVDESIKVKPKQDSQSSRQPNTSREEPKNSSQISKPTPAGFSGANTSSTHQEILLGTVKAKILDSTGQPRTFRGILDPGSQFSFITRDCARQLGRVVRPFHGSISGVNAAHLKNITGKINVTFLPKSPISVLNTEAIVVPSITPPLPSRVLDSSIWEAYYRYDLSDPEFTKPAPISFLIGADLFTEVLTGTPIIVHEQGPRLIETVFGFTAMGKFSVDEEELDGVSLLSISDTTRIIERFWEVEEPSYQPITSPADEECEKHFVKTHRRTETGRYVVSLPFLSPSPTIVPNIHKATQRFYALERKFLRDDQLREDYSAFMKEYIELGHMSVATSPPAYVIPHHNVYKTSADGTRKIRVVFDASFRTPTGSLNDHLHTGPKLQNDIGNIILNFRRHKFVMTADIIKCFRQILVEPTDRKYQQIVWRFRPSDPLTFYELNTVTYGLRSSPFHSCRVLRALASEEGSNYPAAAEVLLENTYIDDCTFGANTMGELQNIKSELIELLRKGGFELSKWSSNCPSLLKPETSSQTPLSLGNENEMVTKILGIRWDPKSDAFSYDVNQPPEGFTKRIILSIIARLFDPLGYLAPSVFFAKCILQRTWTAGLDWDDPVPESIRHDWIRFTDGIRSLEKIQIPRAIRGLGSKFELVCFCDASERGYCGVAYLRASDQSKNSTMTLLKAKTVLAPLKTITLPRLELCGAVLLSEVIKSLRPLISKLSISTMFCFTDSTVVLAWIKTAPHRLQAFVANRVQKIIDVASPSIWYHIRGVDNPADAGTRGVLPSELAQHRLWWDGPDWCSKPISSWPLSQDVPLTDIPELKIVKPVALATVTGENFIVTFTQRFSSLNRLVRVLAWMRRFFRNTRLPQHRKRKRKLNALSAAEYQDALHLCIRMIQLHYHPEAFRTSRDLPLELRRLDIFVDHCGMLRVGGRLVNAPISEEHKHPLLLPSRSHLTNLIIDHHHRENHHVGPTGLLAFLRQRYWIPRARTLIRLRKSKCVTCIRFSHVGITPFMGQLPKSRFESTHAFSTCGVDFAGPFLCRQSSNPRAAPSKAYLCLFICLSSRAVHLELATSLSVEGFLDAFDRFSARRGLPSAMFSDNGTNFVGATGYLQEIYSWFNNEDNQDKIINSTSHHGISWHFNPPFSPHMGGSWESNIKVAKSLLYKEIGQHPYSQLELATMFSKIEAIMNSRPLIPLSDCPQDAEPLTPGHLLIGRPLNSLPEPDFSEIPTNRLNRWQLLRERVQAFWRRWKNEYLSTLQERQKWHKRLPNLKVGDIVILKDTKTSPTYWPLARILEVCPGEDECVRVVIVKTSKGTYKRSATNVIPLPRTDDIAAGPRSTEN